MKNCLDVERKWMYSNSKPVQCAETPLFPDIYITAFRYQYDFKESRSTKNYPQSERQFGLLFFKKWDK